jgi:hypothetical protein
LVWFPERNYRDAPRSEIGPGEHGACLKIDLVDVGVARLAVVDGADTTSTVPPSPEAT